ncbi:MAG: hypothetical protein KIT09_16645 [Bryobacteraceae bacterium]|nr:hypothetical protein [Bryobacteraceae bacterium]
MISAAVLERPGRWRVLGLAAGLAAALLPGAPLVWEVVTGAGSASVFGGDFALAVGRSLIVGGGAAILALVVGFPTGLLAGLYRFRGRRVLLAGVALPLLIPSFLWAIGLSMLRIELGLPRESLLSGATGCIFSFAAIGVPLVIFAVLLAVGSTAASNLDATRLAGGELAVLRYAGRACFPAALSACLLGGILSLADPGPGQILGFSGAATQVLVSFSALYDFELAARQCIVVAGVVLAAASPLVWFTAGKLAAGLLPRNATPMRPARWPAAEWAAPLLLGLVFALSVLAPVAGLVQPVLGRFWLDRTWETVARTGANTVVYALLAGLVATGLATWLAVCAARVASLRIAFVAGLIVVFVLPPALNALGTALAASGAPAWLDPVLRSRLTVGAVLGLRLTPLAGIVLLRAMCTAPASWALAAAVHGVPLGTYCRRVLAPFLAGPIAISVALVALLATADVTTVLLLQPPGQSSFPVALFTVMANAPESMVGSLALAYVMIACIAIAAVLLVNILVKPLALARGSVSAT